MITTARLRTGLIAAGALILAPASPQAIADSAEAAKAREMLGLFLRKGQQQPHAGEQVTRLLRGRVRETRQLLKHGGPGRTRIEYLAPPHLAGEIILITGGRYFQYKPAPENKIFEGVAPPEQIVARVRDLQRRLQNGSIQARVVGQEEIAGRDASIIEIRSVRGGAFYLKFWIDTSTGVRLKYNNLDPAGTVISETYFTKIDYSPTFSDSDFRPASLPNVPHEALLPRGRPFPTVTAAQQRVPYSIREPGAPEGFKLVGAWVAEPGARKTTILRYSDGVNSFTLFQLPAQARRPMAGFRPVRSRNGVAQWVSGGMAFILIGDLKPAAVQAIADSLQPK